MVEPDIQIGEPRGIEMVFHHIREAETGELLKSTEATGFAVPREGERVYLGEATIRESGETDINPDSPPYVVQSVDYDYLESDIVGDDVDGSAMVQRVTIEVEPLEID